jgi:3-dehydroquinate dehydratase type I
MSLICIPIREISLLALKKKLKAGEKHADVIEIWADQLPPETDPAEVVSLATKPLLIVNKGAAEKGQWHGSEKERLAVLKKYAAAGASYIDVAIDTDAELIQDMRSSFQEETDLILSYHNFEETPPLPDLQKKMEKGIELNADIIKVATYANTAEDNLTVLQLLAEANAREIPFIGICMGIRGKLSRVVAPALGSYITYVALHKKEASAPGQLTLKEFKKISSLLNS